VVLLNQVLCNQGPCPLGLAAVVIATLLATAPVVSCSCAAAGLQNPGFEQPVLESGTSATLASLLDRSPEPAWRAAGDDRELVRFVRPASKESHQNYPAAPQGRQYVKLTERHDGRPVIFEQVVDLPAGVGRLERDASTNTASYEVAFDVRRPADGPMPAASVLVILLDRDTEEAIQSVGIPRLEPLPREQWVRRSFRFAPPAEARPDRVVLRFVLRGDTAPGGPTPEGRQSVMFDHVELVRVYR
jgi:hypothetical protein